MEFWYKHVKPWLYIYKEEYHTTSTCKGHQTQINGMWMKTNFQVWATYQDKASLLWLPHNSLNLGLRTMQVAFSFLLNLYEKKQLSRKKLWNIKKKHLRGYSKPGKEKPKKALIEFFWELKKYSVCFIMCLNLRLND